MWNVKIRHGKMWHDITGLENARHENAAIIIGGGNAQDIFPALHF